MLLLLVQGPRFEKCHLLRVSRMKHTQIVISCSDGGSDSDDDNWVIAPISHVIF